MERYTEPTQPLPETLPQLLKPLLRINYIIGTFPYKVNFENGHVFLSKKSFHYYRTLTTLFLVVVSVFALILRVFQVVLSLREANIQGTPLLPLMIELICSIHANFITMLILLLVLLKRKIIIKFITEMIAYSKSLRGYTEYGTVFSAVRKLYALYTFLGLMAGIAVALRCYHSPKINAPVTVWLELTGMVDYVSPEILSIISGIFAFYLVAAKFACLGNLEIVSCTQAICFSRTMKCIMEHLENQMEMWRRQFKGLELQVIGKEDFLNLLASSDPIYLSNKSGSKFKLQSDLESYIDQIRDLNPSLIGGISGRSSPPASLTTPDSTAKIPTSVGMSLSGFKTTPGRALGHAARKYLHVASMQNVANSVFGTTLGVNIGCIVVMIVILKYLVITSFIGRCKRALIEGVSDINNGSMGESTTTDDPISNLTSTPYSNTTFIPWNSVSPFDESSFEWIMFLGLDISMCIRLGVTVICLGKVHKTSLQFNQVMNSAFLTANRIVDEIATVLTSNSVGGGGGTTGIESNVRDVEEITRALMSPTQTSSMIAFMNLNNANPVAFTAGGLFVFSRALLLMIVSIIVSYLVFLLQASF